MNSNTEYKKIIENHSNGIGTDSPLYHCQQDSVHLPCNYYCSLIACGKTFSTAQAHASKERSEMEAAKLACIELNLLPFDNSNYNTDPTQNFYTDETYNQFYSEKAGFGGTKKETQTQPNEMKHLKTGNSFTNRMQPTPQKSIKEENKHFSVQNKGPNKIEKEEFFNQQNKESLSQYLKTLPISEKKISSDTSPISVSSVEEVWSYVHGDVLAASFKSLLHLFVQEENAEHPKFGHYELSLNGVQVFKGTCLFKGQTYESIGPMQNKKQAELSAVEVCLRSLSYLQSAITLDDYTIQPYRGGKILLPKQKGKGDIKLLHDISFVNCLPPPIYRIKETVEGPNKPVYTGYCWLDNKIFITDGSFASPVQAKHSACFKALKYFNINVNKMTYYAEFHIHTENKIKFKLKFARHDSPFYRCPSDNMGWINTCYADPPLLMDGRQLPMETLKETLDITFENKERTEDAYRAFLDQPPSFQCMKLKEQKDLMVCEVDSNNPNSVLVGNKNFSIKLYCENQKLYCQNRNCLVSILPGHNISGLECYYIITPSNDIYLKAESCHDLFFPNRTQPVVRSCSMVFIMHDQESGDYPYVLFGRNMDLKGFPASAQILSDYLCGLITGDTAKRLNLEDFTQTIEYWKDEELERLSEMTMDSMHDLYSNFTKYDNRWNEVFMKPLTGDLTELKQFCHKEIDRRRSGGLRMAEEANDWKLLQYAFKPRLLMAGPYIEDSVMCALRGFRNYTGIRLQLGDVDKVPFVDVPVKSPNSRGAHDRFFIWARTADHEDKENYHTESSIDLHNDDIWCSRPNKNKGEKRNSAGEALAPNTTGDKLKKNVPSDHSVRTEHSTGEGQQEDGATTPDASDATLSAQVECKWFLLTEAPSVNSSFKQLIESPTFGQVMTTMKKHR